jgi:hypothetical protein
MKQEIAQRGLTGSGAMGALARQRAEHEGQTADVTGQIAVEGMQAKERAAGTLAGEGLREKQFEEGIRQFSVGSDQWNKSFEESRRQFEVGSEQWNESFSEQRRQYDKNFNEQRRQFQVGSAQWDKSFEEQIRQYDNNFNEQRRQFSVGSDQWNESFNEQRRLNNRAFYEQQRQFDVGSEQWEKSHEAQLNQWQKSFDEQRRQFEVGSEQWDKSFKEERRRYDNEDKRWWTSFDEQRRQFEVGSEQWTKSFNEQQRQFDVGTDQWEQVQDLRVKDFQRQLDMDKHTVNVWKDNVSYRDKAYYDARKDVNLQQEMERDKHEKDMKLIDLQINNVESSQQAKNYWDGSERVYNYVSTHLDGFNEKTGEFSPDAEAEMFNWYKNKYPDATTFSSIDGFKNGAYKKPYEDFKKWAASEWKAATDNRLTNPYDKMLYDVNSSTELDDDAKKVIKDVLSSPDALASIAGVTYNKETGQVEVKTNDPSLQPNNTIMPSKVVEGMPSKTIKGVNVDFDVKSKTMTAPGPYSLSEGNPFSADASTELKAASPSTVGEFQKQFNDNQININTLKGSYDNLGKDAIAKIMRNSGNPDSPNNRLYKQLATDAPAMKSLSVNDTKNEIKNVPSVGAIFNLEGRLMVVTDKGTDGKGLFDGTRKHDYFKILDLSTGVEKRWGGKKDGDYVGGGGSNLKTWALNLDGR